jgi:hypothetical protein
MSSRDRCPHCGTVVWCEPIWRAQGQDGGRLLWVKCWTCPDCLRIACSLVWTDGSVYVGAAAGMAREPTTLIEERLASPPGAVRPNPPPDVPAEVARDYIEAAATLSVSPKASAALSRRCLQHVLREALGVKHSDLATEIDEVIANHGLPSFLEDQLDAVRSIGNFAAHPTKATATGAIVDVEPEEADWNLDVLDSLFDDVYVKPAQADAKKAALNQKLTQAGKPTLP